MITAVSLNPSIDRTLTVENFTAGGLNRVLERSDVAAGKGINVALAASALGLDAECIGFMYADSAPIFERRLIVSSTPYDFITCEGSARTNIKVLDRVTGVVTELNEAGRSVSEADLTAMLDLVSRHAEDSDMLVLSGSMPPGCPPDFYRTLIHAVEGLGCRCALDADGERLRLGLEAAPYLIKPNRSELEAMEGCALRTLPELRKAALKLIEGGVSIVAVSLGAEGAMITDGNETLFARKLNVDAKSTVGAGDSMVAGLCAGIIADDSLEDMFRIGVASATARCITPGGKQVDKTVYKACLDMVQIERVLV